MNYSNALSCHFKDFVFSRVSFTIFHGFHFVLVHVAVQLPSISEIVNPSLVDPQPAKSPWNWGIGRAIGHPTRLGSPMHIRVGTNLITTSNQSIIFVMYSNKLHEPHRLHLEWDTHVLLVSIILAWRSPVVLTSTVIFSPLDTTSAYLTLKPWCLSIIMTNWVSSTFSAYFLENPCCKPSAQESQVKANHRLYVQLFFKGLHCNWPICCCKTTPYFASMNPWSPWELVLSMIKTPSPGSLSWPL